MSNLIKRGTFRIAEQIGPIGHYGVIEIAITLAGSRSESVSITIVPELSPAWQSGILFGLHYAIEHLPSKFRPATGFFISVESVEANPVDTTAALLAFVAAKAFWNVLGIEAKFPIEFSRNESAFLFAK